MRGVEGDNVWVVLVQVLTYAWGALTGVLAFTVYCLFVQVRAHDRLQPNPAAVVRLWTVRIAGS